jgi:MFS family permease
MGGIPSNVIAMLNDRGVSPQFARFALSLAPIGSIAAQIASGLLVDRFSTTKVAAPLFLIGALGVLLLQYGASVWLPLGGAMMGVASGAEVTLAGYFISRYFGLRAFAAIYSYIHIAMGFGLMLYPYLLGREYDATHSYAVGMWGAEAALVLGAVCLCLLGPFVFPARMAEAAEIGPLEPDAVPAL